MINEDYEIQSSLNGISSIVKPMLLLFGSWVFAFLLGVTIHEIGHALAYLTVGIRGISIHLHPFELNFCSYLFTPYDITNGKMAFGALAGPMFNIIISTIVMLSFWKFRKQYFLPFLMMGPASYIPEGVGMIMDLVDEMGDWSEFIN
ncbi:MAG: hypothetical protein H7645_02015 [Candidatus Heimdallarchaeota archaeon]|nr:hypothetical protein [Candidatus Heimdallarchaeota archaeon]MCK4769094.1 hypothetical protein [Candidatus Heimdallarchaeota archaeon]